MEYIFRDGLYLTPLSHDVAIAVGEIGVSQAAIGAPLCGNNDIGTAPATPHSGTSRRGSTAHVVPSRSAPWRIVPESIPVSFSFVSFASTLSLSLSHARSFYSLSSFLIPTSPSGCASLPLYGTTFRPAPSLASTFAFLVPLRPLLCRFATASRTPFPLHARSTSTSLPRRRDRRANIPLAHNPSTKRAICNN